MRRVFRWVPLLLLVLSLAAGAQAPDPIVTMRIEGVINPLTAQYVERGLARAERDGAQLVLLEIDTPGGLESSMRTIVQGILESPVPVAVYVHPQGARATSAGMFITLAGHVAAMSPATHIGAAHPVPLGAEVDEVMAEKMASDAAALVRGIAEARGRNVEWAERAVRDSVSLTAEEALDEGVIDLIAVDAAELLQRLDGRAIQTTAGERALNTAHAPQERVGMTLIEQLMHTISDPNIAYLLLSAGMLFLLAELSDPGLGVGAFGAAVCFVLAFVALGSLPVNWAGVALLAAAVVLFVVALLTDTEAIVSIMALIPFVLGSLLLFSPFDARSPALPSLRVSPWLIAASALTMLAFSFVVLRAVVRAVRMPPRSGAERLIGMEGIALTDLDPTGMARVDLQDWSAVSTEGRIGARRAIRVVGVLGVRLQVEAVGGPVELEPGEPFTLSGAPPPEGPPK